MQIGYIRVSTNDQNTDLQRNALNCAGCELITEIFVAVTAGAVAYLLGQHEGWELSITYLMVTIASNNGHEVISGMKRVNIDSILNVLTSLVKKGGGK